MLLTSNSSWLLLDSPTYRITNAAPHLLAEGLFDVVDEWLEHLFVLVLPLLLDIPFLKLETLARSVDQSLALELRQVLHSVLVDRVGHEDDLDVLGEQLLHLRARRKSEDKAG